MTSKLFSSTVVLLIIMGCTENDKKTVAQEIFHFCEVCDLGTTSLDLSDSYEWPHPHPHPPSYPSQPPDTTPITTTTTTVCPKTNPFPPPVPFIPDKTCPSENQTLTELNTTINWPETDVDQDSASVPICLDDSLKVVKRHCGEYGWAAEPNCPKLQNHITPCPPGLISHNARYCYKVIRKTTFPPNCPYANTVPWDKVVQIISKFTTPVWMPVRRSISDLLGIDVYRFIEPTYKYKMPYQLCTNSCKTIFYNGTFADKHCLVYHNSTYVEAVSCDEEYRAVCVYDAVPYQKTSFCKNTQPGCRPGDFQGNSLCFCETDSQVVGDEVLATFLSPYQNFLFTNSCRIGLLNNPNSETPFTWQNSSQTTNSLTPLTYTYWSPEVNYDNQFGVFTKEGWILSATSGTSCYFYQLSISPEEGIINLTTKQSDNTFYLGLSRYKSFLFGHDEKPLVFCFTNSGAKSVIRSIANLTKTQNSTDTDFAMTFSDLDIDQSGPGYYWCEAFLYPDLKIVTSEKILLTNVKAEYVVIFKLKNYDEKLSSFPLTSENIETLQNLFKNEIPSTTTFYPRVFRIDAIDEEKKELNITFHLTSAEATGTTEEFELLKNIAKSQTLFSFLDFRKVDYCPSITTSQLGINVIWPETKVGYKTFPLNGYCVTINATIIEKSCIGNFIEGAYWVDNSDDCQFFFKSAVTEDLLEILTKTGDDQFEDGLDRLLVIVKDHYNIFNTLDFVISVNFLRNICDKKMDMETFAGVISYLMQIQRAVLLSAQLSFKSTDILLQTIDKILKTSDLGEWTQPNVAIKLLNIAENNVRGIQIYNCSDNKNCNIRTSKSSNILSQEDAVAAIVLSDELYNQIITYSKSNTSYNPKLILSVYYGSNFFVEMDITKSSNIVFGIQLPDFPEAFKGPVSIYYYANVNAYSTLYNCSYWRFNITSSGSWAIEDTRRVNEAVACDFYHLTNFRTPIVVDDTENENEKICNINDFQGACRDIYLGDQLNDYCITENFTCIHQNYTITPSEKTKKLLEKLGNSGVSRSSPNEILQLVQTLTENCDDMSEIDLFFALVFMKELKWETGNQTVNFTKLTKIMDNILEVSATEISKAQKRFKFVDELIDAIERIIATGEVGEWTGRKFAIKILDISSYINSLTLHNCVTNLTNCTMDHSHTVEETRNFTTVDAVIALSNDLHNQILNYSNNNASYKPKMAVALYFGQNLFMELPNITASKLVFSILLPGFTETFNGPVMVIYTKAVDTIRYNCSYWKYNNTTQGYWEVESNNITNQYVICNFFHLTTFAITLNEHWVPSNSGTFLQKYSGDLPEVQFANHLELTLKAFGHIPINTSYISSNISLVNFATFTFGLDQDQVTLYGKRSNSKFSMADYFQGILDFPDAVKTYLEILNKTPLSMFTLNTLADLADSIMNLDPQVVLKAQVSYKGADKILHHIDTILETFSDTNEATRENIIFVTISKEDASHFYGISIDKYHEVVCILKDDYVNNNEHTLVIYISPELHQQIKDAKSRVILAVFFNNVLFPSNENESFKTPIVEVLVPNIKKALEGSILIKYNDIIKGSCSYWSYDIKSTIPGYWKKEFQSKVNSNSTSCKFNHVTHFALVASTQNITTDLEEILASNLTSIEKIIQVETITSSNHNNLVAVDIFLISQILTSALSDGPYPMITTKIISSLFKVPRDVLRKSQQVHSATDIILYFIDEMARQLDDSQYHQHNFSLIVKNLENANVTGIIVFDCESDICSIELLDFYVNVSSYSTNESVSAMVLFDKGLVEQIGNLTTNATVGISLFYSDAFFNEVSLERNTSKIFGIIFPGLPSSNSLDGNVSVIYNLGTKSTNDSNQCAYWNYNPDPSGDSGNGTPGEWMEDSNKQRKNKMAICSYAHVTHFGMLLANNNALDDDPVLDLITSIGCGLSIFGIVVILLTAMIFKKWRRNTGNVILMNFSIAISLKIIALYISVYVRSFALYMIRCTVIGVILHYAILSECTWMLTVAILQFKRFVEVLGGPPKYVLIKALICGWVFPLIPVICVVCIDPNNYIKGMANVCYPSNLGLYLGVWLPILIILTINCIIFVFIIYNVFHKKTECIDANHDILFQWRLALLLFFMLGLNWTFGFLGQINGDVIFTYLYTITASLQGFVLFLFFIVFNKSTRFLYTQTVKQWFYTRGFFRVWQSNKSKTSGKM